MVMLTLVGAGTLPNASKISTFALTLPFVPPREKVLAQETADPFKLQSASWNVLAAAAFTVILPDVPVVLLSVAVMVVVWALNSVTEAVPTPFVKFTVAGYEGADPLGALPGPVKTIVWLLV
jgi:hypothetical protein